MNISVFNGSVTNTKPTETITIVDFLDRVRVGYYKTIVDQIRSETPEKQKELKTKILPSVTISGKFTSRKDAELEQYSQLIAIDIDHRDDDLDELFETLKSDPYIFALFRSVSGSGLCAILLTTKAEKHQDHFRWADQHFKQKHDVYIDPSCRNISRARFVSYDADLYFNQLAQTSGTLTAPKPSPATAPQLPTTETQINRIVTDIVNSATNIAESYEDYLTCAFALASEYGETGRTYFHAVAMQSSKYNEQEADRKFTNALNTGRGEVKIASFIQLCKNADIEIYTREEREAFAIAQAAKRSHSDIQSAVKTAEASGLDTNTAKQIATKVFETDEFDHLTKGDSIINQIAAFIKLNTDLKKNTITQKLENNGEPINDEFYNSIYIKAKSSISNKVTKTDVQSIIESDIIPRYCPIKQWLDDHQHLPDQPTIINDLLNTIPYKEPKAREFLRHWLLGIPSTYNGNIVRLVLVLCGIQETGKTQFFRRLLPEGLQEYYSENNLMDDSETALVMGKSLINMDDEFGGKSRKDALKFKELTSKAYFDVRLKYGRTVSRIRRLSMLCGTSNNTEILNDETGNTRILPVEFNTQYDFEAYNAIDKDQLFIELFRAHERGESWELSEEARDTLQHLNEVHKVADFELELIDAFLEKSNSNQSSTFMSTTEIKTYLERASGQKIISMTKLGVALKKRFDQKIKKSDGKTKRGFQVVTCNPSETTSESESYDPPF